MYLTAKLFKIMFKFFTFCNLHYIEKISQVEADINIPKVKPSHI